MKGHNLKVCSVFKLLFSGGYLAGKGSYLILKLISQECIDNDTTAASHGN
jgi:hypothetical protein